MPLVFFCDASEPRFVLSTFNIRYSKLVCRFKSTLNAILRSPEKGGLLANNLVFRYNAELVDDGVGGEEGGTSRFRLVHLWTNIHTINFPMTRLRCPSFLTVHAVGRRSVSLPGVHESSVD